MGALHHATGLKIKDISREFSVTTYASIILNDNTKFAWVGKVGDSVIKKPFSDTLKLIHENHIYRYRFEKYDPEIHY